MQQPRVTSTTASCHSAGVELHIAVELLRSRFLGASTHAYCRKFESLTSALHRKSGFTNTALDTMASVVVVGGGGREHAIVKALAQSDKVHAVFAAPGNGGTESMGGKVQNINVKPEDIAAWASARGIKLVVVGPEQPLVDGVCDQCTAKGVPAFGPSALAAEIEASKAWSKAFMNRHGLKTAAFEVFQREEGSKARDYVKKCGHSVVVKASGLAAGKGVLVPPPNDVEAALEAVNEMFHPTNKAFGAAGDVVVIEQLLIGPEISLFAFCDGTTARCMLPAQDHKRAYDGDRGPNTGGMGAYAPTPQISASELLIAERIMQQAVTGLKEEGRPFVGCLYGGFMLTQDGPYLLEFNARFGDPETQVVLPLLKSDCFDVMSACAAGKLDQCKVEWCDACACTVVVAAGGYPDKYDKGLVMAGVDDADALPGVTVYHAGTKRKGDDLVTSGGRVVAVTAVASELQGAVRGAYAGAAHVRFSGAFHRGDIARRCLDAPLKLGVLGSTRGTSLQAVLDAVSDGSLKNVELACVLSNKKDAGLLERCRPHCANVQHIPAKKGEERAAYDARLTQKLLDAGVEIIVCVGWMRIFSPEFCRAWRGRCVNVHPSLLPKHGGLMDLDVHASVLKAGDAETGCTVHLVTEDVDGGAVLVQKTVSVAKADTKESLKAEVQALEGPCLVAAVDALKRGDAGARFAPRPRGEEEAVIASGSIPLTYAAAGVSIDAGNELVERIKPLAKATTIPGCEGSLGGFGSVFDLAKAGFGGPDVLLVSGTDGVGTKLRLAQRASLIGDAQSKQAIAQGLGIDLVAMCANDIACMGAQPLWFLDYYATGALDIEACAGFVAGVADGCAKSGCALSGGETAEMPGLYGPGDFDVAGFCVGAVRKADLLPRCDEMQAGDVLIGVASSGIHANGFSLVRKALAKFAKAQNSSISALLDAPASSVGAGGSESLASVLLEPTRLYASTMAAVRQVKGLRGAAHITGGGLTENLPRALPDHLRAVCKPWVLTPLFEWLRAACGGLPDDELLRTFNAGIGLVLVVSAADAAALKAALAAANEGGIIDLGVLEAKAGKPDCEVIGAMCSA